MLRTSSSRMTVTLLSSSFKTSHMSLHLHQAPAIAREADGLARVVFRHIMAAQLRRHGVAGPAPGEAIFLGLLGDEHQESLGVLGLLGHDAEIAQLHRRRAGVLAIGLDE